MLLGAPSARLCPLPQWRVAAVSAAVVQIKEVRRKWQPWPEPRAERGVKVCSYPGDYQAAIAWSAALAAGWGPPSDDPVLTQPCVQPTHIQLRILSSNWIVSFNITWWSISIPGGVLVTVSYSTTHAFTILIFHCLSFVINTFTISNDSCHWVAYLHTFWRTCTLILSSVESKRQLFWGVTEHSCNYLMFQHTSVLLLPGLQICMINIYLGNKFTLSHALLKDKHRSYGNHQA